MTLVVVAALVEEMAPLARQVAGREAVVGEPLAGRVGGRQITLLVTGDGARRSGRALSELLADREVEAVIGMGAAGGLTGGLDIGQVVVIERVIDEATGEDLDLVQNPWTERGAQVPGVRRATAVSATRIAATAAAKRALAKGVPSPAVVDLETASWVAAASAAGVPLVVARCVSDTEEEDLPFDFSNLVDDAGSIDRRRVVRAAALRPWVWPDLLRLRRRMGAVGDALAAWSLEVLR